MTLLEFGQRAFDHDGSTFNDAPVQLTGFVAAAESRRVPSWRATRSRAARPMPLRWSCGSWARVATRRRSTNGSTVTGTFRPSGGEVPELAATSIVEIEAPNEPYE